MSNRPIIVWFRQDLRLADNVALTRAVEAGAPIIPLFVLDDGAAGEWALGGASRWWLHNSLVELSGRLADLGVKLVLRHGSSAQIVPALAREVGARAVHFSRQYEPWATSLEAAVHAELAKGDGSIEVRRFPGALLKDPGEIRTKDGRPYKVYTPFWRALIASGEPRKPLPAPTRLAAYKGDVKSEQLSDWNLLPKKPDWAGGLHETWTPGERGAHARLETFLEAALTGYDDGRNRPDRESTSRLSPHLHFGELSPSAVWHTVKSWAASQGYEGKGLETFLKELVWREFSAHLLFHFPDLPSEPLRTQFNAFPWCDDAELLRAWQQGRTGFPIVDAGMRQLWHTGWMHNRVRMITASFLIKDLLIHWCQGEAWFWDTLVDADLASNAASWQWVAGCGADAAPYFRVFNPVTQGEKFDPGGTYVRQWVPELAKMPAKSIHAPWLASQDELKKAGVVIGDTYPRPIVDHAEARKRALAGYEMVKA